MTPFAQRFESYYLYGVVEPTTGQSFHLELPNLDTDCFQIFIEHLSQQFASSFNLVVLDSGAFHKAKKLQLPQNVGFVFLPAYSPELNPIERLWEDIKAKVTDQWFDTLEEMKRFVGQILRQYTPSVIQSLTGYPYFTSAIDSLFP